MAVNDFKGQGKLPRATSVYQALLKGLVQLFAPRPPAQCGKTVRVSVVGAGSLIGPDALALAGGSVAFWVSSEGAGEIRVTVDSPRFGLQELRLKAVLAAKTR